MGTISVAGILEGNVPDGKGKIFVNLENANEIAVLDVASRKQVGTYKLPGCKEPTDLPMTARQPADLGLPQQDRQGDRCVDRRRQGHVRNRRRSRCGDSRRSASRCLRAGSEGYLTIIDLSGKTPKTVQQLPTAAGAHTGALDPKTGKVYIPVGRAPATDFGARAIPGFAVLVVAAK